MAELGFNGLKKLFLDDFEGKKRYDGINFFVGNMEDDAAAEFVKSWTLNNTLYITVPHEKYTNELNHAITLSMITINEFMVTHLFIDNEDQVDIPNIGISNKTRITILSALDPKRLTELAKRYKNYIKFSHYTSSNQLLSGAFSNTLGICQT